MTKQLKINDKLTAILDDEKQFLTYKVEGTDTVLKIDLTSIEAETLGRWLIRYSIV